MQYNYGLCDKPNCEYCTLVKQATAGAVEPPVAATAKDLKAGLDDLQNKLETAALQEIGERAGGDYNVAKNLGARVDAAVSGLVHGVSVDGIVKDKKATDADGAVYIVDPAPTGTFAGHANQVASLSGGTWHFQAPAAQETHLNESDNQMWTWNGTAWVKVGSVGTSEKVNDAIHKATTKVTPADNDELALADSATTPVPFGLAKLTWGNLKKTLFKDATLAVSPAWGSLADGDHVALIESDTGTSPGKLWKMTWGDFKKAIWGNFADWTHQLAEAADESNIHDDAEFAFRGSSGDPYKSTWPVLRAAVLSKFGKAVKDSPAAALATDIGDNDLVPLVGGSASTTLWHATWPVFVANLRAKLNLPVVVFKQTGQGGDALGGVVDISACPSPRWINYKGWCAPIGAELAVPVLVLSNEAGVHIVDPVYTDRHVMATYGSGGVAASGFTGVSELVLTAPNDASYHTKGNTIANFDITIARQNDYLMIDWTVSYEGRDDVAIFCTGYCSGELPAGHNGPFTQVGVQWINSPGGVISTTWRNTMCDVKVEAHS